MEYFKVLNLTREPFSNSPDPDLFYRSRQHLQCLQQLEISVRLKRGLNVVIGEVGTGKTTLCRHFIRQLSEDESVDVHLILDPDMPGPLQFLESLRTLIEGRETTPGGQSEWELKEWIKNTLFERAVTQDRTEILVIDEGQKMPAFGLEILRELLNYEANNQKLLQIVIFAQREFSEVLESRPNFADRINVLAELGPMSFSDTRGMIRYRLEQSRRMDRAPVRFTFPALVTVYRATGGYPRKIINLCHQVMLALIVQNRMKADRDLVRAAVRRDRQPGPALLRWGAAALVLLLVAGGVAGYIQLAPGNSPGSAPEVPDAVPESRDMEEAAVAKTTGKSPKRTPGGDGAGRSIAHADPGGTARPAAPTVGEVQGTEAAAGDAGARPSPLGTLVMLEQETLWYMASRIYAVDDPGRMKNLVLARILSLNPELGDPGWVEAGTPVRFPIIEELHSTPPQGCWLRIDQADTLAVGYARFKEYRDLLRESHPGLGVRLVTSRDGDGGVRFHVVLDERLDVHAAHTLQERLSRELGRDLEVVDFSRTSPLILAGLP